ncbi:hypothetical protein C8R44DRAFT_837834 [Mycena epipterygia]|nr:hypothetical protein C8R44DRAFT_837834 [Mycena epipterygia]
MCSFFRHNPANPDPSHHPLCLYVYRQRGIEKSKCVLDNQFSSCNLTFNDTFQQLAVKELPCSGVGESGCTCHELLYFIDAVKRWRRRPQVYVQRIHLRACSMDMPEEAEPFLGIRYAPYTEENFNIIAAPAFLEIPEK